MMQTQHILQLLHMFFTVMLAFLLGKSCIEKRQLKQQAKQLKQWQQNHYKSFADVSNALHRGKFVVYIIFLIMPLGGCTLPTIICPNAIEYSLTEQQELNQRLQQYNDQLLNRYIIDYANLRAKLKACVK